MYASSQKGCRVLSVDLLPLDEKVAQDDSVLFLQGDFGKLVHQIPSLLPDGKAHVVMSDMAANFTGDQRTDALRTMGLVEKALAFSSVVLQQDGVFLAKFFSGPEEQELKAMCKESFNKVQTVKPPASRQKSAERYLVARGFR